MVPQRCPAPSDLCAFQPARSASLIALRMSLSGCRPLFAISLATSWRLSTQTGRARRRHELPKMSALLARSVDWANLGVQARRNPRDRGGRSSSSACGMAEMSDARSLPRPGHDSPPWPASHACRHRALEGDLRRAAAHSLLERVESPVRLWSSSRQVALRWNPRRAVRLRTPWDGFSFIDRSRRPRLHTTSEDAHRSPRRSLSPNRIAGRARRFSSRARGRRAAR